MTFHPTEDIRSVTDLKRKTREMIDHVQETGRPMILTTNGKADAVLMDAKTYEKHLKASNLSTLLMQAEADVASKKMQPMRTFLKMFKHAHKI